MTYRNFLRLLLMPILLIPLLAIHAQDEEPDFDLNETLEYQDEFTIDYPEDWITDISSATPILATSELAFAGLLGEEFPEGEVVIVILLASEMERSLGITPDVPIPEAFAQIAASSPEIELPSDELEADERYTGEVYSLELNIESFPFPPYLIGTQLEGGFPIFFQLITDDYEASAPLLDAMIASITYTPDLVSITEMVETFTFPSGTQFALPAGWTVETLDDTAVEISGDGLVAQVYDQTSERVQAIDYSAPESDDPYADEYHNAMMNYVEGHFLDAQNYDVDMLPEVERTIITSQPEISEKEGKLLLLAPLAESFVMIEVPYLLDDSGSLDEDIYELFTTIARTFTEVEQES